MDDALPDFQICGTECHHCGRTDKPIYLFDGTIIDPNKANNPQLAIKEPEVCEVCADCIKAGNIEISNYYLGELENNLEYDENFPKESIQNISATPCISGVQRSYWPTCCNDFTEYVGHELLSGESYDEYQCRNADFIVEQYKLKDFYPLDSLPVMYTMHLFRCNTCNKKYWDFQYSGLLWKGPTLDSEPKIKEELNKLLQRIKKIFAFPLR